MSTPKRFSQLFFLISFLFLVIWTGKGFCFGHEKLKDSEDALKLLIDTDMGLDDVRSLFALFNEPSVDIQGIITSEGSASIGKGTDNLIGLMEAIDKDSVPIYRGHMLPDLKPPSWRTTANQLGGASFPPPRKLSAITEPFEKIKKLINESEADINYLALGPLSNLAQIAVRRPDIFERLHAIWIPVTIMQEGQLESWNLSYDHASTIKVFSSATNLVLIDLSQAKELDGCQSISSIRGSSAAAKWIEKLTENLCPSNGHIMIFDEMAAAALVDSNLIMTLKEHFSAQWDDGVPIKIFPDGKGNIKVARLKDPSSAMDLLKKLWEQPKKDKDMREQDSPIPAKILLKTFHGHLGPYVVLGYRMGKLALRVLESEGHFGISTEVHSYLKPPKSCLIDGLQLGSGCTLGKANITVHEFNGPAYATFKTKDAQVVTIRLRAEIPELVSQLIDKKGVEAAGEELLEREIESLFEIEKTIEIRSKDSEVVRD